MSLKRTKMERAAAANKARRIYSDMAEDLVEAGGQYPPEYEQKECVRCLSHALLLKSTRRYGGECGEFGAQACPFLDLAA